jgi:hypothetical protein
MPKLPYQREQPYRRHAEEAGVKIIQIGLTRFPEQWEKDAIIDFHHQFPLEGYRRLTFMMLDRDIVARGHRDSDRYLERFQ